jgi:putative membrane protein
MDVHLSGIVNAALYAFLGIFLFVVSFIVIDKLTPYHLWNEIIHNKNLALAIFLGAVSIGICIIIAAAVH